MDAHLSHVRRYVATEFDSKKVLANGTVGDPELNIDPGKYVLLTNPPVSCLLSCAYFPPSLSLCLRCLSVSLCR